MTQSLCDPFSRTFRVVSLCEPAGMGQRRSEGGGTQRDNQTRALDAARVGHGAQRQPRRGTHSPEISPGVLGFIQAA